MAVRIEFQIPSGTPRTRLEDFLFGHFPRLSRMYLRDVVRSGACEVNGRHENVGFRIRGGDFVEIDIDPARESAMRPADIPLDIVFEDDDLIVVNKPAGMLAHPTHRDKTGTLLNALAFHLNGSISDFGLRIADFDGPTVEGDHTISDVASAETKSAFRLPQPRFIRPGLVHRLDKQTSGLIVIAKCVNVHRRMAVQFQRKMVEKRYVALVEGVVQNDEGVIEGAIGRYAERKRWDVKEDGKASLTRFWVRARGRVSTILDLEPVTGRTNQLRIHCAAAGHAIVGDPSRGGREHSRLCLHAYRLAFNHPTNRHRLEFEIDAPPEFALLLA